MAQIFADGFESGDFSAWDTQYGTPVINSSESGRTGKYCCQMSGLSQYLEKNLTAADEYFVSARWKPINDGIPSNPISVFGATGILIQLFAYQDAMPSSGGTHYIIAYDKNKTALAVSTPDCFQYGQWHNVNAYFKIHATAGRVIVLVDRIKVIDFTGDTIPGSDTEITKYRLGFANLWVNDAANCYFDEVGVNDSYYPASDIEQTKLALEGRSNVSIYLNKQRDADDVISEINAAIGAYLFNDWNGKYRLILYEQLSGDASMSFTDPEVKSLKEITDASEIISKVKANYQHRLTRDFWQVYVHERAPSQYLKGSPIPIPKEIDLPYTELADARVAAQKTALYEGERIRTFQAELTHRALRLLPGDFVQITSDRHGINAVLEVLEVEPDFLGISVTLILASQRGLIPGGTSAGGAVGNPGYWTGDSPVFPASLGGGSLTPWDDTWTDAQKEYARQNAGYWTEDSGFADATDPDSYLPSTWV